MTLSVDTTAIRAAAEAVGAACEALQAAVESLNDAFSNFAVAAPPVEESAIEKCKARFNNGEPFQGFPSARNLGGTGLGEKLD